MQVLAGIGSNSQLEVWTKPLGGGRTAALVVNTANKLEKPPAPVPAVPAVAEGNGNLNLVKCNSSRPSQNWLTTPGAVTHVVRPIALSRTTTV